MSRIPTIILALRQQQVEQYLYAYCLRDKELPFTLRAMVINQYRKKVRREAYGYQTN